MLPTARQAGVTLKLDLADNLGKVYLDPEGIYNCLLKALEQDIDKMHSKNALHERKQELLSFCEEEGAELLVLFGSMATHPGKPARDVDLAVALHKDHTRSKLQLVLKLETILYPCPVDLVLLSPHTPPLLLFEIFSKGELLYEERTGLFEKAKLRAWHLYLDTEKLRKRELEHVRTFVRRMKSVA